MFVRHRLPNFVVHTSWVAKHIFLNIVFMLAWGIEREDGTKAIDVVLRINFLHLAVDRINEGR